MTLDRSRRTLFNSVAALYDVVRPGYPETLPELSAKPIIDIVMALCGREERSRPDHTGPSTPPLILS